MYLPSSSRFSPFVCRPRPAKPTVDIAQTHWYRRIPRTQLLVLRCHHEILQQTGDHIRRIQRAGIGALLVVRILLTDLGSAIPRPKFRLVAVLLVIATVETGMARTESPILLILKVRASGTKLAPWDENPFGEMPGNSSPPMAQSVFR